MTQELISSVLAAGLIGVILNLALPQEREERIVEAVSEELDLEEQKKVPASSEDSRV